jgi:hypothetical protein
LTTAARGVAGADGLVLEPGACGAGGTTAPVVPQALSQRAIVASLSAASSGTVLQSGGGALADESREALKDQLGDQSGGSDWEPIKNHHEG